PDTNRAKKGIPFWVSITASNPRKGPMPKRAATIIAKAAGYTLYLAPPREYRTPLRTSRRAAFMCREVRKTTSWPWETRYSPTRSRERSEPPPCGWVESRQHNRRIFIVDNKPSGYHLKSLTHTRAVATFSRAWKLLRSFRFEQTQPHVFYSGLAHDTALLIDALCHDFALSLSGARVLDDGGGPGYLPAEFESRGARHDGVEPDAGEMSAAGIAVSQAVRGDGTALPFRDDTFEVVYSSNVAEHIPNPWAMAD